MSTRTTVGQVKSLGQVKQIKDTFYKRHVFLNTSLGKYGHQFTGTQEEMQHLETLYPVGTTVYVLEEQNGQFWRVKEHRHATLDEAKGQAQEVPKDAGNSVPPPVRTPRADTPPREDLIVRQNALSQANSFMGTLQANGMLEAKTQKEAEIQFFQFAEKCEAWVQRPAGNKGDL